jgi:hypothetical protein
MALRAPTKDIPAGLVGNMGLLGFIGRRQAALSSISSIASMSFPLQNVEEVSNYIN